MIEDRDKGLLRQRGDVVGGDEDGGDLAKAWRIVEQRGAVLACPLLERVEPVVTVELYVDRERGCKRTARHCLAEHGGRSRERDPGLQRACGAAEQCRLVGPRL